MMMTPPNQFYPLSETVWIHCSSVDAGMNNPPITLFDGYGVAGPYHILLVNS